jgi:hypothetical protein
MSDISADKHYKLICGEGRALLKHICKTCRYLRTIVTIDSFTVCLLFGEI